MPSNKGKGNLLSTERLDTFWDTLWLELRPFFYSLATVFVKIMEENGRKVKKGMPKVAYRHRMAHVMHIISLRVRLKRVHKQNIFIFPTYFACPRGPEYFSGAKRGASRGGFGVIWRHFGAMLHTLGSLWNHLRYMSVALESLCSVFKIYSFSQ